MVAEAKFTFYDFLNYEVIGCLILVLCRVFIPMFNSEWMFFAIALIAGLIFSKLAENAFWVKWIRNANHFIIKAEKDLRRSERANIHKRNYLKDYYTLSEKKTFNTIRVLEAQFAFIYNLLVLLLLYTIINCKYLSTICLDNITFKLFTNHICCSKICQTTTIYFDCFAPMVKVYLLLVISASIGILCHGYELVPKRFKSDKKETLCGKIRFSRCSRAGFRYIIAGVIITTTLLLFWRSLKSSCLIFYLIIAIIILSILAYYIQKKISYLIVEGAYFNNLLKQQKIRSYHTIITIL